MQAVYRQYSVLVNDDDSQNAESNWTTIQTAKKHVYLHISKTKSVNEAKT